MALNAIINKQTVVMELTKDMMHPTYPCQKPTVELLALFLPSLWQPSKLIHQHGTIYVLCTILNSLWLQLWVQAPGIFLI
ncbi:hypothetical protein ACHAW6_005920 [Cyclotella cf. meneghiniana]